MGQDPSPLWVLHFKLGLAFLNHGALISDQGWVRSATPLHSTPQRSRKTVLFHLQRPQIVCRRGIALTALLSPRQKRKRKLRPACCSQAFLYVLQGLKVKLQRFQEDGRACLYLARLSLPVTVMEVRLPWKE